MEAALVIESGADVEAFVEMEVPSLVSVGIVVDENWASHRDDVHYIVVERSMVVIPGRHSRSYGVLLKEIKRDFSVRK